MADECSWAVKNGDLEALEKYLEDPNMSVKGRPLLVSASDYGQTDIIKHLIKQGADVNQPDSNGITPLLAAIWEEHIEAVQILLQSGASTTGKCPDGSSYIDAAQTDSIKKLLKS